MTESSNTMLNEKLDICEAVVSALRSETDMAEVLKRFSVPQQLIAIRFMEFLADDDDPIPGRRNRKITH